MREIKLNLDHTLNILVEPKNKMYVMQCNLINGSKYFIYYLLSKFDQVYGFSSYFKITNQNEIEVSFPLAILRHEYIQYCIQDALGINEVANPVIKVVIFEFDTKQEFINWYKDQKVFNSYSQTLSKVN